MAGVVADSVIVAVEGRFAKYERDFNGLIKKTETGMAKLRQLTKDPVTINTASSSTASVTATNKIIAAKKKQAEAERATARTAASASASATTARNREATAATAAAERIRRARLLAGSSLGSGTPSGIGRGPSSAPYTAINRAIREAVELQARLRTAQAASTTELRSQLTVIRNINRLRGVGLADIEAIRRAEQQILEIRRRQAATRDRRQPPVPPGGGPAPGADAGGGSTLVGGGLRTAGALVAGYVGVQGIREYLALTDAYKQYNAQLKLATAESGNLALAQTDVLRIANETRSGISETANLYAVFQRNAAQLGLTQQETAQATEIITKSFKISGASAAEAAGGLRQFLQGLQSGTLRGEEFNSIVENAPRLAKIFADQLTGGNIGALRALAAEGKITGVEIKKALADPAVYEQINKEFRQLPVTFEDAMTVVKNAATVTFGEFDQGGQFSTALVNFITGGSEGFADLAKAASDTGIEIRAAFEGLGDAFAPLFAGAQGAFAGIRSEANYTRDSIANILSGLDQLRNAPGDAIRTANSRFGGVTGYQLRDSVVGPATGSTLSRDFLRGFQRSTQEGQNRVRETQLSARFGSNRSISEFVSGSRDALGNRRGLTGAVAVNQDLKKLQEQNADLERLKLTAGKKELGAINKRIAKNNAIIQNLEQGVSIGAARAAATGAGGRSGPSAATLAKRAEAARLKEVRKDDAYNSEVENLNSAILSAKGKQAQSIEQTAQAAIDNANAELKERELKYQNQENEGKISDQQRLVLNGLAAQVRAQQVLAANTEKAASLAEQALRIASDAQNNEADAIRAQLDITTTRKERARLEKELLDKEYEARRTKIAADLQDATQRGDVAGQLDAEGRLRNLPAQQAAEEFSNRENNKSVYEKYRDNLNNADSLADDIDNIKIEVLDRVADSLSDAAKNALGLSGALGDVVGQIIKIGIQRKLIGPLADALFGKADGSSGGGLGGLFGSSGNSGGIFSSIAGLFGGARASGGDVTAGRIYKVNEMGPELFQPAMSGKIIPTGRVNAGRSGSTVIQPQINVDARGAVMNDEFARSILARANQTAKAYATQGGIAGAQGSKAVIAKQNTLGT